MSKIQQNVVLIIALCVGGGLLWQRQNGKVSSTIEKTPVETGEGQTIAKSLLVKKEIVYHAASRDPLLSPMEVQMIPAGEVMPPTFTVQGMVWGGARPMCIVGDKVFKVGDEIEGAKITEINRQGVRFLFHGKTLTVIPQGMRGGGE